MAYLMFLRNVEENQISHFFILPTWCNTVKWLKLRHFCVEFLYICVGSWYTVFWKQPPYLTEASTVAPRQPCTIATICFYAVLLCIIPWCRSLADRNV